ncbi:MAG TPA: methyltransferase domain-containing protein [Rhizomicrobium sp.]|jgi:ubiquinone/menaquinone biosynthesis C-methylase UbiE
MSNTVHNLVAKQFSPRAAAYVQSAVHAQGEDLNQLAKFAEANKFGRALDLGCGGGHASFTIAPHVGEIIAYDLSAEMLGAVAQEAANRGLANLKTQQGTVEKLPFPDASFDFVTTRYSAHHWHDIRAGLREARRVLKPGAHAMFMDAVPPENPLLDTFIQTIEMLRDPSHVRDYSVSEWTSMLREAGFEPALATTHRIHLDFATWTARMQTKPVYANAILALQKDMSEDVVKHFAIEPDGSFMLDSMSMAAVAV